MMPLAKFQKKVTIFWEYSPRDCPDRGVCGGVPVATDAVRASLRPFREIDASSRANLSSCTFPHSSLKYNVDEHVGHIWPIQ